MSAGENNPIELGEALREAHPSVTPSAALMQRVAQMAEEAERVQRRRGARRRIVRGVAQLTAAAGAITLFAIAAPKVTLALTLNRMASAMETVQSVHMTTVQVDAPESIRQTFNQGEKWRLESRKGFSLWTKGILYEYSARENRATFQRQTDGMFAYASKGFTMSTMLRDMARWGWTQRIEVTDLGSKTVDGRTIRQIGVRQQPIERERMLFTVDAATDLPIMMELQDQTSDSWRTVERSDLSYNEQFSPDLFTVKFPKGTRLIDFVAEEKVWKERLSHTLAETKSGTRRIRLRDVSVTSQGDVFVLYTDGARAAVDEGGVNVSLKDDKGTVYVQSRDFQPYVWGPQPRIRSGIALGEERLQGAWFIPVQPTPTPWQPRRFQITFADDKKATLTRAVTTTTVGEMPDHILYTARWTYPDLKMHHAQITARRQYQTAAKNWRAVIALSGEEIVVENEYRRTSGYLLADPYIYLARYRAFYELGQFVEARAELEQAKREDHYGNCRTQIEAAEKELANPR